MDDTDPLKKAAQYGAGVCLAAAPANPLVGGAGLVICGTTYMVAHWIDRQNRRDSQKDA
jgi:hypothetical protein